MSKAMRSPSFQPSDSAKSSSTESSGVRGGACAFQNVPAVTLLSSRSVAATGEVELALGAALRAFGSSLVVVGAGGGLAVAFDQAAADHRIQRRRGRVPVRP